MVIILHFPPYRFLSIEFLDKTGRPKGKYFTDTELEQFIGQRVRIFFSDRVVCEGDFEHNPDAEHRGNYKLTPVNMLYNGKVCYGFYFNANKVEKIELCDQPLQEVPRFKLWETQKWREAIEYCLKNSLNIPIEWVEKYNEAVKETNDRRRD